MNALALSAILPSALLVWYFYSRDTHPEPGKTLLKTFGLGVLTVLPVLVLALPGVAIAGAIENPWLKGGVDAFLTAAFPEELCKLLVLLIYCWNHPDFDEPMDGVVYGAVASLGFATLENILYVSGGGMGTALMRAVTAVPGHAFTGAIFGYFVGRAKYAQTGAVRLVVGGYLLAVLLHGLYDWPLLTLEAFGKAHIEAEPAVGAIALVTVGALLVEWRLAVRFVTRLRAEQHAAMRARAAQFGPSATPGHAFPLPEVLLARSGSAGPFILLGVGFLVASIGGLVALALVVMMFVEPTGSAEKIGGAIVSAVPMAAGVVTFGIGLRKLPARTPMR